VVAGAAHDIGEAVDIARRSIDSGAAQRALEGFVEASNDVSLCDD
jgi:anthranilate phosphoribosyltransferase